MDATRKRKRKAPSKPNDKGSSAGRSLIVVLKVPKLVDMAFTDISKPTTARYKPQTHGTARTDSPVTEELRGDNGAPDLEESPAEGPSLLAFPPLPPLLRADIEPFWRGAGIAMENILEEFVENDEATLMRVIRELESNRPQVHDHERKTVLKGGTFVYETLKWMLKESSDLEEKDLKNKRHTEEEAKSFLDDLAEWTYVGTMLQLLRPCVLHIVAELIANVERT